MVGRLIRAPLSWCLRVDRDRGCGVSLCVSVEVAYVHREKCVSLWCCQDRLDQTRSTSTTMMSIDGRLIDLMIDGIDGNEANNVDARVIPPR